MIQRKRQIKRLSIFYLGPNLFRAWYFKQLEWSPLWADVEGAMWIGKHVVFDGWFKPSSPLGTVGGGYKFLVDFVATLEMTIVVPPHIIEYPVDPSLFSRTLEALEREKLTNSAFYQELHRLDIIRNGSLRGISGLVVLAESHITYHTFPDQVDEDGNYFVSLDVYSCKDYESNLCGVYLAECGIVRGSAFVMDRFTDKPQSIRIINFPGLI
jgi:hypothetical protein